MRGPGNLRTLMQEFLAGPLFEGGVGAGHKGGGWDVGARGWGSFEQQGEAGQSFHEGDREMRQGVDREVTSERGGGDGGAPI